MESSIPPPQDDHDETDRDPELISLGSRIRQLRHDAGLTQEALATTAGFHWSYVGQIERGERNPTYKNLLRLAHGLSVPPWQIVQDDPAPEPTSAPPS